MAEALIHPEFFITDGSKSSRPAQIHNAFRTLDKYIFKNRELPKYWLRPDSKYFFQMAKDVNRQTPEGPAKVEEIDEDLLRTFAHVCRGVLSPIDAIIGGVVAQEITKACTGKYTPIVQWLYFDAVECLPNQTDCVLSINKCKPTKTRYDGLVKILFLFITFENIFILFCVITFKNMLILFCVNFRLQFSELISRRF